MSDKKFNWDKAIPVGVLSAVGVAIIIIIPERIGLGIGFLIGAGMGASGLDKIIYQKLKGLRKRK